MFDDIKNIDIEELDRFLWLSSPILTKNLNKHKMLYSEAVKIGKDTAAIYPINNEELADNLKKYGVVGIEYFSEEIGDRSYYVSDDRKIYLNEFFISEMSEYIKSQGEDYFSAETITDLLTIHEFFHHIEETTTTCTDKLLSQKHKTSVIPIYREIAAFSFVNTQREYMPCQLLDLFWLKKHRNKL